MNDACSTVVHEHLAPARRVPRWGAIVAGLFTTLATMALLAEIGMAAGLSAFEPGEDRATPFLVGAGVWGLVSVILSFLAGGYVSALLSGSWHKADNKLHGFLVWAAAIPTIGLVAALVALGAATAAGTTAAATAAAVPEARAEVADAARAADTDTVASPARSPQAAATAERVAKTAGAVGWGLVLAMLLALGASILGGTLADKVARRRVVVDVRPAGTDDPQRVAVA